MLVFGGYGFDIAGVGDKHYAIAENLVEKARQEYKGNWIEDKRSNFSRTHGELVECEGDEAWSDEEGDEADGAVCCRGVCVRQIRIVQARFNQMRDECLALLRLLRSVRRKEGYSPNHGVITVLSGDSCELLEVHALARVSFAPLDFTSVQMRPYMGFNSNMYAEILLSDGKAILRTMAQLLHGLATRSNICLGTVDYQAEGLGRIMLTPGTEHVLQRPGWMPWCGRNGQSKWSGRGKQR